MILKFYSAHTVKLYCTMRRVSADANLQLRFDCVTAGGRLKDLAEASCQSATSVSIIV